MKSLYHISRKFLGNEAIFTPQIPTSQNEKEYDMLPRVCAAPSVDKCWDSISVCTEINIELRNSEYTGFYFFIYKMDSSHFTENTEVMDYNKTEEYISFKDDVQAELVDAFYIKGSKIKNMSSLDKIKEFSSIEEAVNAYNDWQKDEIERILKTVNP